MLKIIVFLTNDRILGRNIISSDKVEVISIEGSSSITCKDTDEVDEFVECLLEGFRVRSFEDEDFDLTILDCNANKEILRYLAEKCEDSQKLNVISIDKVLPAIVLNKKKLQPGDKVKAIFAGDSYVLSCNEDSNISVLPGDDGEELCEETLQIKDKDFSFLYAFSGKVMNIGVDEKIIKEKNTVIETMQSKLDNVKKMIGELLSHKVYPGAVVLGNVIKVDKQGVHISFVFNHCVGSILIPCRYQGLIPCSEWEKDAKAEDLTDSVSVGDVVTSVVIPDLDAEEFAFMIDERVNSTEIEKSGAPLFTSDETITLSRKRFSAEKMYKRSSDIS